MSLNVSDTAAALERALIGHKALMLRASPEMREIVANDCALLRALIYALWSSRVAWISREDEYDVDYANPGQLTSRRRVLVMSADSENFSERRSE